MIRFHGFFKGEDIAVIPSTSVPSPETPPSSGISTTEGPKLASGTEVDNATPLTDSLSGARTLTLAKGL